MAKKKDSFYFDNFVQCIEISCRAARTLREILGDFGNRSLEDMVGVMHKIEHEGDTVRHELTSEIARAFITPVDRDDLIEISSCIDGVTDAIEDVILLLYTWNISELRPDVIEFADFIIRCCEATEDLLREMPNFKKSKILSEKAIYVNHLESEGDEIYIRLLRNLSLEKNDALTVIAWRNIYQAFETVCDCCEDVADMVAAIAISNT